jgi:superfamily II DNA or RNA helicase
MITVYKLNESFLKIECESDVAAELSESFSFLVPGYKFVPAYKLGRWDGYIRLFHLGKRTLPIGLFDKFKQFCSDRNYEYTVLEHPEYGIPGETFGISYSDVEEYIKTLGFDTREKPIEVRDYQIQGAYIWLNNYRAILLASVGSGKSLMMGVFCRCQTEILGNRVLIVVPTIGLTTQLKNDFIDYFGHTGWDGDDQIHCISAGVDKNINKPITISTFQSLTKVSKEWLNGFDCIIADEGHKVVAASIAGIFEKATKVKWKLACTGTVHDTKCHILHIIGLTGPVHEIAPTAKLIENGQLVPLDIKCIVLKYSEDICKVMKKADYDTEIKYIVTNEKRNNFIAKLANCCSGVTLVLYRFVELQGLVLYNRINELTTRPVHFINGGVIGEDREEIRIAANFSNDDIIVASIGTMSTGINLPAIENIIFCHPTKSKITNLQSIGRGLRMKEGKSKCVLYDIVDDFSIGKSVNITLNHFSERLKMYTNAGFQFKITTIKF